MFINIAFFLLISVVKSAKILVVVPAPFKSHETVFRPLIQELVNRHHNVTVLTPYPIFPEGNSPNNLKEIDLHDLSHNLLQKDINEAIKVDETHLSKMKAAYRCMSTIIEGQLRDISVLRLIKNKDIKFDLIIVETCVLASLIFSHVFNASVISMSSFGPIPGNMKMIGSPTHPLLYPTHFHQRIHNLTFWEKINELYNHIELDRTQQSQEIADDVMLQRQFGIDTPSLNELKNNVHMLFLNFNQNWLLNQPVPLNLEQTWSSYKTPGKMLPKDLQIYLDSSTRGVIYVSFGSVFQSSLFPPETLAIFVKVFSRLPYNILWKFDMDELPGRPGNMKIYKWTPQCDVLRHANVKLFITHGGLQSTVESISAGVPLLGIPQFSDQQYNTDNYVYFEIGTKLEYKSITMKKLENSINTIFGNYNRYKKNIIRLQNLMDDQPMPPLERAIWWIEYVIRHGGALHLRAPAADMSWTEYYELDVVFIVVIGLLALLVAFIVLVYICISRLMRAIKFIFFIAKLLFL